MNALINYKILDYDLDRYVKVLALLPTSHLSFRLSQM